MSTPVLFIDVAVGRDGVCVQFVVERAIPLHEGGEGLVGVGLGSRLGGSFSRQCLARDVSDVGLFGLLGRLVGRWSWF